MVNNMKKNKNATVCIVFLMTLAMLCAALTGCGGGEDKVDAPFASNEYQGRSYQEVVEELETAGFENIQIKTMMTYSESKAGTVGGVTIDGDHSFFEWTAYDPTVPVIVSYYKLKIEVTIDITIGGEDGKPVFTAQTNLPDGTVLNAELAGDEDSNFAYLEQQEIIVQDGVAVTEAFTLDGEPLMGVYRFGVVMFPAEQTEEVQEVVGAAGGFIRGNFVEKNGDYAYVMASTQYQSPIVIKVEKISDEEMDALIDQTLKSALGENYSIELVGYTYKVNTWQDGVAVIATLAKGGDADAMTTWANLKNAAVKMSASLYKLLDMNGHGDKCVSVNILNDINPENVLLTAILGLATYDWVAE